ncbi:isoamyl alcohol [Paraphaeosphaeria sporulosa]
MALRSTFFLILLLTKSFAQVQDDWSSLNQSVGGKLFEAKPLASPCFSFYEGSPHQMDAAECERLQKNYTSMDLRIERYAGFANSQDEMCMSNTTDQCLLDSTNPSNALAYKNVSCNQGSVSSYYITVSSAEDAQAAFLFSRRTGTKLSIKATGHDYNSRSSIKGTLALWMRGLQNMSHDHYFVPQGCDSGEAVDAMTFGAGVIADEAYTFADAEGVTVLGPYASTIAMSGGWLQGGGHSVLSPVFGLGVDRVVQFKIVTPDGQVRIENKCQNKDVFWALRGGGGGTFGVVLEATHRVESKSVPLAVASMNFPTAADNSNVMPFLEICVNESLRWGREGWGGHIQFMTTKLIHVTPLLSLEEAENSMRPITEFVKSQKGTAIIEMLPSWYSFYKKYLIPNIAPVGQTRILATRLIPTTLFETAEGRTNLTFFLADIVQNGLLPYIPVSTPFLVDDPHNTTSANPAWRASLWHLGYGAITLPWNSTLEQTRMALKKSASFVEKAEKLAPSSGTYFNEAFPWTNEWQREFWDGNYGELLRIKRIYDPDMLLSCWKCVGFEDSVDARSSFRCLDDVLK